MRKMDADFRLVLKPKPGGDAVHIVGFDEALRWRRAHPLAERHRA